MMRNQNQTASEVNNSSSAGKLASVVRENKRRFAIFVTVAFVISAVFTSCNNDDEDDKNEFTVQFDSRGGSAIEPQTVNEGGAITKPNDPVRNGFAFDGWYRDENFYDTWNFVDDKVNGDMTLYAKWNVDCADCIFMTTSTSDRASIRMAGAGTVKIDWGDDSPVETKTLLEYSSSFHSSAYEYVHYYTGTYARNPIIITGGEVNYLDCNNSNSIMALDVSKKTSLLYLDCGWNNIENLDVSKNTALIYLYCSHNWLTELDVSKNTALIELECGNYQLIELDVSKNTALTYLSCSDSRLTSLEVSKNTALEVLWCGNNQLTNLVFSNNNTLTRLYCGKNQFTKLDVSKNTALVDLYCGDNQLIELDLSKNTVLMNLQCNKNQLTELDVSKNTTLIRLECQDNKLTSTALDALFGTLHSNVITPPGYWQPASKMVSINGNPGMFNCNKSIATSNGWSVDTTSEL